jgi:hypothetical protein
MICLSVRAGLGVIVFNATFNNISAISGWLVFLMEEIRLPGENHRPASSHLQTLSIPLAHIYENVYFEDLVHALQ